MNLKKIILVAFVLSGMAALIYEVVWVRPLQFVLGSTIYTVSIIFAAFMGGLALGSFIISKYVDRIRNLPRSYALLELGIGLYGVLLLTLFNIFPDIYRIIYPLSQNFYIFEFAQFLVVFIILIIPTTLMGATFPVIAKFYTIEKIGKGIGEIYSANNIGAIIGSFAAGFILIPILGIKSSIIFAGMLNIFIGILILFIVSKDLAKKLVPITLVLFLILAYFGDYNIKELYSGGFYRIDTPKEVIESREIWYYNEGLHATITVIGDQSRGTSLLINGKGQGGLDISDVRVNLLLSSLPLVFKPESKKALVIGLGTGTTSGQLAKAISVTTIEIEPAVLYATKYFKSINLNVLENSAHKLVIADGRNYLLKSTEKYDVIIPEPSDPWQSFSTNLFSKEFFELSKEHLSDNGLYLQWVPIYELDIDNFKSFYRTFNSVFPHVIAFVNIKGEETYPIIFETSELILVGSNREIKLNDLEVLENNFDALPLTLKDSLRKVGINSANRILHLFLFSSEQIKGYADDADLVTDDNAKLEFSTSKMLHYQNPKEVISDIEKFLAKNER